MSDNSSSSTQHSQKVTVADAGKAKHGYADESDIAKRKHGLDTPEANENPVAKEPTAPSEQPTTQLGTLIENQDELVAGVQADDSDEQDFETADETVEMMGSNDAQFQGQRDIRWNSPGLDRGEYWTKPPEMVDESLGLEHAPVADQSDREPVPELVDRREGESLAMYEKRVGEEADHERMRALALSFVEEDQQDADDDVEVTECGEDLDAKYVSAWMDDQSDEEPDGEFDATRRRAEASRVTAAEHSRQDNAEFDERAKLEAGLEPDAAWSPKARIGEEIRELGQFVEQVAEKAHISEGQALTLLCAKRLNTSSASEAAMRAVEQASSYFKDAPAAVTDISPRQFTTTVEGEVTRLFTPMNESEYQVALVEDVRSGEKFRLYIHTRTRFSKSWTEYHGDQLVTDLREGDHIRVIDGKPHYAGTGGDVNVKIHCSQWTHIRRMERGDGPQISKFAPRGREIEASSPTGSDIDENPVKSRAGYARKESKLHERRAKPANSPESATNFERRETADPLMVQWEYPASWVPEQHKQHYDVEGEEGVQAQ